MVFIPVIQQYSSSSTLRRDMGIVNRESIIRQTI